MELTKHLLKNTLFVGLLLIAFACGNKASKSSQQTTTERPQQTNDTVSISADANIGSDAGKWGPDSLETVKNYSLYREYYKQKLYEDALPFWRYVYNNAPALRKTPYINGAKIYEELAKASEDTLQKQAFLDSMFMVYDQRMEYFGEEGDVLAFKALKLKKYRPEEREQYLEWITESINIAKEEAAYFILIDYMKEMTLKFARKEISEEQYDEQYNLLTSIVDFNIDNENEDADKYAERQENIDALYNNQKGRAADTCPEIISYWGEKYKTTPNDKALVKKIFNKLLRAKCKSEPLYNELLLKLYQLEPTASRAKILAQQAYDRGDITKATSLLQEALNMEPNPTKQASLYMFLAAIERRKVDNLTVAVATQARKYAKKAAELRPGWGKPYVFIGDLYASSGKLCGPGTGWDSQVVAWAAVDMWEKARDIDPDFYSEATKSINRYAQFYPTKQEGFMKSYATGDPYKIGCWIGTNTRVRLR